MWGRRRPEPQVQPYIETEEQKAKREADAEAHWAGARALRVETDALIAEYESANHARRAEIAMLLSENEERFYYIPEDMLFGFGLNSERAPKEIRKWRERAHFESRLALAEAVGRASALSPELVAALRKVEATGGEAIV